MKYYSEIKRNEVPTRATTLDDLENITLSERRQSRKSKYHVSLFTRNVQNRQIYGERK